MGGHDVFVFIFLFCVGRLCDEVGLPFLINGRLFLKVGLYLFLAGRLFAWDVQLLVFFGLPLSEIGGLLFLFGSLLFLGLLRI